MGWSGAEWAGSLVLAYLIGSIPSAYVAGRLLMGKDIREEGDRNPGAANAYRVLGPKVGLTVGAIDIAKGALAVVLVNVIIGSTAAAMAAGAVAIVGHSWPIFSQLRGGRGAASAVGVFMALIPIPAIPLSLCAVALLPVVKSATIVLGIIMIPMALLAWITGASLSVILYSLGLPILVGLRHFLTTRKLSQREEEQAESQVIPQE